jgi:hypothetical protein
LIPQYLQLRSRFKLLQHPDPDVVAALPIYIAFDLLYRDGLDLSPRSLSWRRTRLKDRGGVFAAGKIFTGDKATIPFEGHTVHPCQVTAYSIATGAHLWLTIQPFPASGPTTSSCSAAALIADRKRVIIGGAGHFGDEFMARDMTPRRAHSSGSTSP